MRSPAPAGGPPVLLVQRGCRTPSWPSVRDCLPDSSRNGGCVQAITRAEIALIAHHVGENVAQPKAREAFERQLRLGDCLCNRTAEPARDDMLFQGNNVAALADRGTY